jgi:hypothetical protein
VNAAVQLHSQVVVPGCVLVAVYAHRARLHVYMTYVVPVNDWLHDKVLPYQGERLKRQLGKSTIHSDDRDLVEFVPTHHRSTAPSQRASGGESEDDDDTMVLRRGKMTKSTRTNRSSKTGSVVRADSATGFTPTDVSADASQRQSRNLSSFDAGTEEDDEECMLCNCQSHKIRQV